MWMLNKHVFIVFLLIAGCWNIFADNPLVTHLFNADPSARLFDGVLYVYASHDVDEEDGVGGFSMADYHVYSSTDMMNFTDHGVALDQDDVLWAKGNNTMWAPDCVQQGDQYYLYFPTHPADKGWGHTGVAISDSPTGPFVPETNYISQANNIDPNLFFDDDGTPYLYICANENIKVIEMKTNMLEAVSWGSNLTITGASEEYKEGPWVFKRDGVYYLTYPSGVADEGGESIYYATGSSPTGPFENQGMIMAAWTNCWTIHHSILEIEDQWYIFYHHNDISGNATLRSMCADKLSFNEDGSIAEVTPTRRGIGIRNAKEAIQVDRYLDGSLGLTTPAFSTNLPSGFYLSDIENDDWVNYPDVDFGTNGFTSVSARVKSAESGLINVRVGGTNGTLLATIPVASTGGDWSNLTAVLTSAGRDVLGVQDLYLVFESSGVSSNLFDVDWVQFNLASGAKLHFSGDGIGEVWVDGVNTLQSYNNLNSSGQIDAPMPVELRATAPTGSYFSGWTLNGSAISSIRSLYAGDIVEANFMRGTLPGREEHYFEAENYSNKTTNIQTQTCSDGGSNISYVEDGSYVAFSNVTFAVSNYTFSARLASGSAGGTVSVHLDSPAAEALASISVTGTGEWLGWQEWSTSTTAISIPDGTHTVYFKFSGTEQYLVNANWFAFSEATSGYNEWIADNGIAGDTDYGGDEDGDGISNLLEYALDFNSGSMDSNAAKLSRGSDGLSVSYIDKLDVDVKLFFCTDLEGDWAEMAPTLTPAEMSANTVYYNFSTHLTSGFFYWTVDAL